MTATRRLALVIAAILAVAMISGYAVGAASAATRVTAGSSYDDEIADAEKEKAANQQRLDDLEDALEGTDRAIIEANRKLKELEAKLPEIQKELELAQERLEAALLQQKIVADKLAAAEAQDAAITQEIEADELRIAELQELVAALARESYKGSDAQASLGLVFGSATSGEFVNAFAAQHSASRVQANALAEMEEIAATNRNRGARQEAVREYIAELKIIADELVLEADAARELAEQKKAEVEKLLEETRELRSYLQSQRAKYEAQQAELEAQQKKVRDELTALIRKKLEEQAAQNPTPLGRGYLSYPTANPYITSSYGWRVHPIYGSRKFHYGTDFRAYCGTPIYAAANGRVEWAYYRGGFGNQVMLDHGVVNGNVLFTSYNHLSRFAVSSGSIVQRGDIVGYSGTTGTSTSCHLHFEVYLNGPTVNPMSVL